MKSFDSITGKGVIGDVDGKRVALGNRALFEELNLDPGGLPARADELRRDGQTVMFVAVAGKAVGLVGVADPVKETTPEAIRALHLITPWAALRGLPCIVRDADATGTRGAMR